MIYRLKVYVCQIFPLVHLDIEVGIAGYELLYLLH